ncbi:MAG: hypothetical protein ABI678_22605 [Kofleriaceae bacterium]
MRSFLIVVAAVAACSHSGSSTTPPRGSWAGPELLANVPAETPYLFAVMEPPAEAIHAKMMGNSDLMVLPALAKAEQVPLDQRLALSPPRRAMLGILDAMRGTDPRKWWENLGLKSNGRTLIYGLGIWPVIRVEVGDPAKLRAIITDAIKTLAMPEIEQKQLGATPYWVASKYGMTAILSVTDHDVAAALVPTTAIAKAVPLVLGTEHVGKSMRDAGDIAALSTRYHLTSTMLAYIDTHRIVDALERKDDFATTSVFAVPACHADFERMADALPRILMGYRSLDAHGFLSSVVFETSPAVAKQLASLHGAMPALPDPAHTLMGFSIAADIDAGVGVLRGWLQSLADQPFQCPQLAITRQFVAEALEATKTLIPKEMHGLHGAELVIEDASESPPGGAGYLLIAGDQIAVALGQALQKVSLGISVAPDGQPVSLPIGMLGMPGLKSAHLALHTSRAALAIGPQSQTEVQTAIAAPNAPHSPLFGFTWDIARFTAKVPSLLTEKNQLTTNAFSTMNATLDVRDDALVLDIGGTWR